jgi:hypothetical protein
MQWIILATLLTGAPEPALAYVSPRQALTVLANEVETGSLIVSRGDCLAVKIYSSSAYTHVAAVVVHEGAVFVYDATAGAGVRKQTLARYLVGQKDHTVHCFHPRKALEPERAVRFEQHLESQLGRPYALHHHLTGERVTGLHCSEYVTDALIAADMLRAREPSRVSPASLVEGILKADLYRRAETLRLEPEAAVRPESDSWCAQMWFDTKECTSGCYLKLRGWFCCK